MGKLYVIKDESGGAATHPITIMPYAGDTIDGESGLVISQDFGCAEIYADPYNLKWRVSSNDSEYLLVSGANIGATIEPQQFQNGIIASNEKGIALQIVGGIVDGGSQCYTALADATADTDAMNRQSCDARYERLATGRSVTEISYASSSGTLWTPTAACIIEEIRIVRTTAWNGSPTLTIGHAGDADWLTLNAQAKLTTAIPAGELAGVETIRCNVYVDATRPVTATWAQGGANAGAGYIVLTYMPLT